MPHGHLVLTAHIAQNHFAVDVRRHGGALLPGVDRAGESPSGSQLRARGARKGSQVRVQESQQQKHLDVAGAEVRVCSQLLWQTLTSRNLDLGVQD